MVRVAIFYCKRIKDHSCIACAKCFKGAKEKAGEFAGHPDEVEIVAMTDCGDCPGLIVPRIKMIMATLQSLGRDADVIHLGTCIKMACEHSQCPIDPEEVQIKIENALGKKVILGTHPYV